MVRSDRVAVRNGKRGKGASLTMSQYTDEEFRKMADEIGDWIAKDVIIHIPQNASVHREAVGVWVECQVLVPWPQESNANQSESL